MQHIGVDLGYRQVVTGVATQGRRGSFEYVTEYYVEFSTDNKTWNIYTNRYGTPMVSVTDGLATTDHSNYTVGLIVSTAVEPKV